MKQLTLLLLISVICATVTSLKILILMPVNSNSHYFTFKPLIEKLAERNHEVTFISPFTPKIPIKNLEYVTLTLNASEGPKGKFDEVEQFKPSFSFKDVDNMFGKHASGEFYIKTFTVFGFLNYSRITCDSYLNSPKMHQFIAEDRSYDLILAEAFHTNCFLGFVQKYNAPLAVFTTSAPLVWYHSQFGLPYNPSYIPNLYSGFGVKMNFLQRIQNLIINTVHSYYFDNIQEPVNYELAKKFFGDDLQDFETTVSNATLFMVNSHFTIMGARPLVPSVLEIGGVHIGPTKPVPKVRYYIILLDSIEVFTKVIFINCILTY